MLIRIFITMLFIHSTMAFQFNINESSPKVIYGVDNRHEVDEYPSELFRQKSNSVALKISKRKLSPIQNEEGYINFLKYTLTQNNPNMCADEKYLTQFTPGDCTGFLIAKNRILTAGHCIFTESDCLNNAWVFGVTEKTEKFNSNDVYFCKKIIAHSYLYTKTKTLDYAIIELDRPTDRDSLEYRKIGNPSIGTPLLAIGHPLGLPMKIVDGASVRFLNNNDREHPILSILNRRYYFTADIDTYSGNSGSPVFNQITGLVEGMLIQGADDFTYNEEKGCIESVKLNNSTEESSEKILRINSIPELK